MKLLIATTNPGKLEEISSFLSDLPIRLIGLKEAGIKDRVEETGKTFEENAVLKAKFYAKKSGLPTIGDDGGIEIDAIAGAPGLKTRRWIHGDRDSTDNELIDYTVEKLKNVPLPERGAQLRAVIAFALPNGKVYTAEGIIRGAIPLQPSPTLIPGFPFRSLLYIPQLGKFYNFDVMNPEENAAYNHRKKALEELKPTIRKHLR